ncbi:SAV_2336 N-terminal domain-related protein [Phytohabitans rumicis]|uniref:Uncharacterized protein n=1 Tax=Phytohabitans rumicis TaxID=1076125 RepID=A0A6V8LFK4_9ACTN|nr:SAV_2336 N-terminal domain-related protein [Phytohabitans rumicis]GFJ95084.1 hypothetical protein Prum_087260 [Phytohabitans rumicis]
MLVFTDGTSPLWTDPRTDGLLRMWGGSGPLAILNPFPQAHWHRTGLLPRRCRLRAPRAVSANDRLRIRYPDEYADPFTPPADQRSLPVPVLELDARWIGWWARLVTGKTSWVDGVVHAVDPAARLLPEPPQQVSPGDRVSRFRKATSATTFRLATYVAAAPLDLPLLRRVQQAMLPNSAPHHLAEVVTSDLVVWNADTNQIDFVTGVREALLACSTRDDSGRVIRTIAAHHRPGGGGRTFTRVIDAPDETPDLPVTAETLPMARIELAVLNALSGPYARRAHRLRRAIDAAERGTDQPPGTPRPRLARRTGRQSPPPVHQTSVTSKTVMLPCPPAPTPTARSKTQDSCRRRTGIRRNCPTTTPSSRCGHFSKGRSMRPARKCGATFPPEIRCSPGVGPCWNSWSAGSRHNGSPPCCRRRYTARVA